MSKQSYILHALQNQSKLVTSKACLGTETHEHGTSPRIRYTATSLCQPLQASYRYNKHQSNLW